MHMHQSHGLAVLYGRIINFFSENDLLTLVTSDDLWLTFDPIPQVEGLELMHMHQSHGHATLYGRIINFLANFNKIDLSTPLMTFDPDEKNTHVQRQNALFRFQVFWVFFDPVTSNDL